MNECLPDKSSCYNFSAMKHKLWLVFIPIVVIVLAGVLISPASASPPAQVYYQTPTAGADGRIIYIVKGGDTCLSISLLTGVDINELRRINNLDEECALREGQQLLLGIYQTPTPMPGPTPTETPAIPTPTPFPGTGTICVYLFDDVNGNALAEGTEPPIAGGAISVTDKTGTVSLTGTTSDQFDPETDEPPRVCFDNLPEGDYTVSIAVPQGYNPTTQTNYPLKLRAGDISVLDFGAQLSSQGLPQEPQETRRSPLLAILGGLMVLGGAGLGIYFSLLRRSRN